MKFVRSARQKVGIAGEVLHFLWAQKLWWMIPMVSVLLLFGLLLILTQGSAIAPFIYTLW